MNYIIHILSENPEKTIRNLNKFQSHKTKLKKIKSHNFKSFYFALKSEILLIFIAL